MTVELVVTPKSIEHIYELINVGADSFVIGEEKYALYFLELLLTLLSF